jgi:hypothetical protein
MIQATRVQKYYKLLKEINRNKTLTPKTLSILVKKNKCSANITRILVNGGILSKTNGIYKWVSPVCTIDTAAKALENLRIYNKEFNKKRKQKLYKKNLLLQKAKKTPTLTQQFINTMPKAKRKYNKKTKREISILWGLLTYKIY